MATIEAFCELEGTLRLVAACAEDLRLARAEVRAFDGGLSAAIERLHDHATPALVVVETGMRGRGLFDQLDELARVCDPGAALLVIGAVDDGLLERALGARGVSYLSHPIGPADLVAALAPAVTDEGAGDPVAARRRAW